MKPNALPVLASNNLACVLGTPSLVLLVEEASLLRVVGMRSVVVVFLAVPTILVDGQEFLLFDPPPRGPSLGLRILILQLILLCGPFELALGSLVSVDLGVSRRVAVGGGG